MILDWGNIRLIMVIGVTTAWSENPKNHLVDNNTKTKNINYKPSQFALEINDTQKSFIIQIFPLTLYLRRAFALQCLNIHYLDFS